MLSIPHMIVVFLVVLVVFGPQKLPELARSFGKLMAEFRKASSDFKNAFEEEMRDLERQARIAELKKQVAEANAAADAAVRNTLNPALPAPNTGNPGTSRSAEDAAKIASGELTVASPEAETIPRLDASATEMEAPASAPEPHIQPEAEPTPENPPSHDQQPAR